MTDPTLGYWGPARRGETWPERIESLTKRGLALGLQRIGNGFYAKIGFRHCIRIDEYDNDVLFPDEAPSDEPHYHGLRFMTNEEMAKYAEQMQLMEDSSDEEDEQSPPARLVHDPTA